MTKKKKYTYNLNNCCKQNANPAEGRKDRWNQWFAGLTDGDGCFYIDKKEKTVSYEITTHTTDVRVLYIIKNEFKAGSVTLRSGSNSVRYRIKQKAVILDIVKRLNGKLYNPARVLQFQNVCALYDIEYIQPPALILKDDGYLSGLIDSDGSIVISVSRSSASDSQISGVQGRITRLTNAKGFSQISLKVTSSYKAYLEIIKDSYGFGTVYISKANKKNKNPNNIYNWTIKSEENFQYMYEYLKKNPLKSVKMHRMRLVLLYFKYTNLKYHLKKEGNIEAKIWAKFAKSWYKYSY
jgi:hypothetical protein